MLDPSTEARMANWQATLLMQTLGTGSVLVLQRDKNEPSEVPGVHEFWVID